MYEIFSTTILLTKMLVRCVYKVSCANIVDPLPIRAIALPPTRREWLPMHRSGWIWKPDSKHCVPLCWVAQTAGNVLQSSDQHCLPVPCRTATDTRSGLKSGGRVENLHVPPASAAVPACTLAQGTPIRRRTLQHWRPVIQGWPRTFISDPMEGKTP